MSTALYTLCQQVFPELAVSPAPHDLRDFHQFIDWVNSQYSNIQYVELKQYYDNGTDECHQLQQARVDIEQLNNRIEEEIEQLFAEEIIQTQMLKISLMLQNISMPSSLTTSMRLQNNMG